MSHVSVQWVYQVPANPGSSLARIGHEGQRKTRKSVLFMEASQRSGSRLLRMTRASGYAERNSSVKKGQGTSSTH